MARNLHADFIAQAVASENRPVIFYEGVFASQTVRLWNGTFDIAHAGQTWLGNGWLQGVDNADEVQGADPTNLVVILSGVPLSVVSLILNEQKQGASGKVLFGFLNASFQVIGSLYEWWTGKYSHAEMTFSANEATAMLHYEHELIDLERPKEFRYSHQSQKFWYDDDDGFEFVIAAANWNGQWGTDKNPPPKGSSGGGGNGNGKRRKKQKGKR